MSSSFFNTNFPDLPIQDCRKILRIEGVGGNSLPYLGFIEVTLSLPLSDSKSITKRIPMLVVNDTTYNVSVPLLLGTNFLKDIEFGGAVPVTTLHSAVRMAVSLMQVRTELLDKANGVLGDVVASTDLCITAHSGVISYGTAHITIPVRKQLALIQQCSVSVPLISGAVEVSAGMCDIPFEIENRTDFPINIKKGDRIAQIFQASVEVPDVNDFTDDSSFINSFDFSHLPEDEVCELKEFLSKHRDIFALSTTELGCTDVVTHKIELNDETPFKEKIRPIPPGAYDELKRHLAELLTAGVITESKSPFSSNMVLIRKRDQTLRLCIDYRRLNLRTIKDSYALPRVDTLLDSLKGARYFASLDLISGYHQVALHPDHCERTAFAAGSFGFYEYVRMPFGLCNAPGTFERLMEKVLEGLNLVTCAVYLDDVVVFASTKEELYERLNEVFARIRAANLRLKPKKCKFLQKSLDFLGYTVSQDGVQCSETHLASVATWPAPTNIKELQTFLGFCNFYRRFISGYASIVQPLLMLLRGGGSGGRGKKKKIHKDSVPWSWGEKQQQAFEDIKVKLISPPVLAYPDYGKPFTLHVDASLLGLGAVLYQEFESKLRPIAYASKSLNNAEKKYSVHKLEFLALKWAMTEKFNHYLYGQSFVVYTDHNPLAYVTTSAKLDATGHRWLAEMSSYNFTIYYKPGVQNADADGMSRRPHPETEQTQCTRRISPEVFKEICALVASDKEFAGLGESLGLPFIAYTNAVSVSPGLPIDWAQEQRKDSDLARVIELVERDTRLTERQRKKEPPGVMRLLSYWVSLVIRDKVLYKRSKVLDSDYDRVVIPKSRRQQVLGMVHDDLGHLGRDKTISVAQERFFWVGLAKDVENKIKSCLPCICAKSPHLPERAPLCSITTTRPLELVCMDFVSLEMSKGGFQNILVITDHFTKYALAFPTRNQEAKTVAKILVDQFVVHYGIPERVHSDQGASFEGKIIKHLCQLLGMKKSRTTPYHPQGDGITERFNRTLLSMLKTLDASGKASWKDHVAPLVHAYNCTRHESTHFSPYFLMFGRTPRLPVDIFLGCPVELPSSVSSLKERLENAYKVASDVVKQAAGRQKQNYDRKVRGGQLHVGDRVLVKNVGLKGKNKLANKWKPDVFVIELQENPDIPVFKCKRENGTDTKTVHRNLLLPLALPYQDATAPETNVPARVAVKPCSDSESSENDSIGSSDSDEGLELHLDSSDIDDIDNSVPIMLIDNVIAPVDQIDAENVSTDDEVQLVSPLRSPVASNENVPLSPQVLVTSPPALQQPAAELTNSINPDVAEESIVEESIAEESVAEESVADALVSASGSPSVPQVAPEENAEVGPRRTGRTRKPPARYKEFVMSGMQTVSLGDWRDRVSVLVSLLNVFPSQNVIICEAIVQVITTFT